MKYPRRRWAPPSGGGCWWSDRIYRDAIAQTLQSFDEATRDLLPVVFVEVVGAEVDIVAVVLE